MNEELLIEELSQSAIINLLIQIIELCSPNDPILKYPCNELEIHHIDKQGTDDPSNLCLIPKRFHGILHSSAKNRSSDGKFVRSVDNVEYSDDIVRNLNQFVDKYRLNKLFTQLTYYICKLPDNYSGEESSEKELVGAK